MRRTRDWIKFGTLVGLAIVLAVGFASIIDLPRPSLAQATPVPPALSAPVPAQQQPVPPEARPLADLGTAFSSVAESVRHAVVFVRVESREQAAQEVPSPMERFFRFDQEPRVREGQGSGFIISQDGYILTNHHVVEGADRVDVRLFDQRQFKAEVIGSDPLTDVAVIKITGDDLPHLALGNSDSVRVGEWVLAVGNPLGDAFSFTVTAGIVSGRGRRLEGLGGDPQWSIRDFIQTDAAINRGNSGGPLVNVRGEVIGINSAIASQTGFYTGYGFAIPMNLARTVAEQLISTGHVTRAQLGVSIRDVDPEVAEYVGLKEIRGVLIAEFPSDDSPAQKAGLRSGDVIVELDGQRVDYTAQLQQLVGFKHPGDVVAVTVQRRGGERKTVQVKLGEANTAAEQQVARAEPNEHEDTSTFEERLGIAVEPFSQGEASRIGLTTDVSGLAVMEVDRDGPARGKLTASSPQQGVLEVVTHVNEHRVRSRADLREALAGVRSGDVVAVQSVLITPNAPPASRPVFIRVQGGMQ